MSVSRRGALSGLALLVLPRPTLATTDVQSPLSPDDAHEVERVVAYLEGLTSARGRFEQTDGRGGRATGMFYLQRPGKARFDYDPPSGLVIASDGHKVTVVDRRLRTIRSYPLGLTPLGLFLARNIRLDRGVKVREVDHGDDTLTVVAENADERRRGSIALRFSQPPLSLSGWTLTDARGARVTVRLADLERTSPWDSSLFVLKDPRPPVADPGLAR